MAYLDWLQALDADNEAIVADGTGGSAYNADAWTYSQCSNQWGWWRRCYVAWWLAAAAIVAFMCHALFKSSRYGF
jgi:hypothetical protein